MSEVKITYNGRIIIMQFQPNETLETIFNRFKTKIFPGNIDLIYLYKDEQIQNLNITMSELTSDKNIIIKASASNDLSTNVNNLVKSEYVICPTCKESAILEEKDYKLKIYGCEKGHINENILINQFNKIQEIDYSKIICQKCEKKRSETYRNTFYYCCTCKINLCPLCKDKHNNHTIIDYDDKWFKCTLNNRDINSFCNKCKKNICTMCENNHKKNHNENDLIYLSTLIIEDNEIKNFMKKIRKEIDIFNNNIREKIDKLNKIIVNIEEYYKIINNIIEKYITVNDIYKLKNHILF